MIKSKTNYCQPPHPQKGTMFFVLCDISVLLPKFFLIVRLLKIRTPKEDVISNVAFTKQSPQRYNYNTHNLQYTCTGDLVELGYMVYMVSCDKGRSL